MNGNIIGGMSCAEGYMVALANIVADREICGDNRQSFLMITANQMSVKIREAINYIVKLESEIGKLKEENSMLQAQIKELREALKPVRVSNKYDQKCDCYHEEDERAECWGTKERSLCTCGGDKNKCDFYGG